MGKHSSGLCMRRDGLGTGPPAVAQRAEHKRTFGGVRKGEGRASPHDKASRLKQLVGSGPPGLPCVPRVLSVGPGTIPFAVTILPLWTPAHLSYLIGCPIE